MSESHENMASSADILLPSSDVMNKAGMCGTSIEYVTSDPFLFFIVKEQNKMAASRGAHIVDEKVLLL